MSNHHHDHCNCSHDNHEHHDHCNCSHDNHEHHDLCNCSHDKDENIFNNISPKLQHTYIIEGLDCANCAAKMERKLQAMKNIDAASITFATKQLRIAAENPTELLPEIQRICSSIESNVIVKEKNTTGISNSRQEKSFLKDNAANIIFITIGFALLICALLLDNQKVLSTTAITITYMLSYIILGWKVLFISVKNIIKGQIFDENFLMSIATIAAFGIGEFAEGVGVMLFYRIGELFEHAAVEKSRKQIMDAVDMRAETVNIINNNDIEPIPAEKAVPGDLISVRPGERIPLDAIVLDGESRLDTSPVTGESVPTTIRKGDEIYSGCINISSPLTLKVLRPLSESMVSRILNSVENAAAGKPKIDKFITRFAKVYTPIVVALAIITAVVPSLLTNQWELWIKTAVTFLVISCPCALVISVPLAFFSGIGAASKLGILFKGGSSIEALKKIKTIIFDKTGTLTEGNFKVQSISTFSNFSDKEVLSLAASCETGSTHPIAQSILDEAKKMNLTVQNPEKSSEISGMGIKALISNSTVLCGNKTLMESHNISVEAHNPNGTEVYIAIDGILAGLLTISDTIKEDAAKSISSISSFGIKCAMLTGDTKESAQHIAEKTGILEIYSQLLPDDKLKALKNLRKAYGPAMFVGDGINDAPVLAGADVGAAMGTGADAAIEAADIVFMNSSISAVSKALKIAQITGKTAMQNVIFALTVKVAVLAAGLMGFASIWAAVFADTGVAMLCILNSLKILWKKY